MRGVVYSGLEELFILS